MDNFTHGLFGYALGRALGERAAPTAPAQELARARSAGVLASVLASNAPDLDFVVRWLVEDPKLAYLLHHRGYTHTLVCALPLGALIGLACARALRVAAASARRRVVLAGALAALLHIAFDALNEYGVHPLFPLDDRWYYGDAVFIVEPLLLAALLPLLVLHGGSRVARALGAALVAALLALVWLVDAAPSSTAVVTSVGLVLAFVLQARVGPRAWPTLAASALVVLSFGAGSVAAERVLRERLTDQRPGEQIGQLVVSPLPANPLCWSALAVSLDGQGTYRVRVGAVTLWPALVPLERCRFRMREVTTAKLTRSELGDAAARFDQVFEARFRELRALRETRCDAAAALRFMRAPFWAEHAGEQVLGDLRYDREPELGFAEIALRGRCPDAVPPWVPPLAPWLR